ARARTLGGTGLGLAISLEDARLHGGRLEATGTPGEGARFRLTLPRRIGIQITRSPLPLRREPLALPAPGAHEDPAGPAALRTLKGARGAAPSPCWWRLRSWPAASAYRRPDRSKRVWSGPPNRKALCSSPRTRAPGEIPKRSFPGSSTPPPPGWPTGSRRPRNTSPTPRAGRGSPGRG